MNTLANDACTVQCTSSLLLSLIYGTSNTIRRRTFLIIPSKYLCHSIWTFVEFFTKLCIPCSTCCLFSSRYKNVLSLCLLLLFLYENNASYFQESSDMVPCRFIDKILGYTQLIWSFCLIPYWQLLSFRNANIIFQRIPMQVQVAKYAA